MNSKLVALSLCGLTAAAVAFYPGAQSAPVNPVKQIPAPPSAVQQGHIDVVFALDTTGSMGGLIQAAKEKIWSIATTLASAQNGPQIRIGLVAYRDRGDAYVTRRVDLSTDLDSVYAALMDFRAAGGGDTPESVNQALYEAVHNMSWRSDANTYKVVFLVGDAPPHMNYANDTPYGQTLAQAKQHGIIINAIQAGSDPNTARRWQQIAQLGAGNFFKVGSGGNAIAIASPYDEKIASLAEELDGTRIGYGDKEQKARLHRKRVAIDKLNAEASTAAKARRGAFNSTASGVANLTSEGDLVADVASGRVELESIAAEELPEPMRAMAPAARQKKLAAAQRRRADLRGEIRALAAKRDDYLREKVAEEGTAKESLDGQLFDTIRTQAAGKGLNYEVGSIKY